jgi:hypothetical protein
LFINITASFINLPFLITANIALIGMVGMLILKMFIPKYKVSPFDIKSLPSNRSSSSIIGAIKKDLGEEFTELKFNSTTGSRVFIYGRRIYSLTPLTPDRHLRIRKNDLIIDDKEITGLLEAVLSDLKTFSKQSKIKEKYLVPLIYVKKNNELNPITTIKVATRNHPDRPLGNVHIVSPSGFKSIIRRQIQDPKHKLNEEQYILALKQV